jgi:hypothetical protein
MPPPMLNGFEMALRGRMDNVPQPIAGPVRDDVFDAVSSYRDMMKEDNYERKMTHLMTQGYSKEEVDEALSMQRKKFLMDQIAKPTPVAPVSIQSAMEKLVRREFNRPMNAMPTDPTGPD